MKISILDINISAGCCKQNGLTMCSFHAPRYVRLPSKLPLGRLVILVSVPSTSAFRSQDFFHWADLMPRDELQFELPGFGVHQISSPLLSKDLGLGCQMQNRTALTFRCSEDRS